MEVDGARFYCRDFKADYYPKNRRDFAFTDARNYGSNFERSEKLQLSTVELWRHSTLGGVTK